MKTIEEIRQEIASIFKPLAGDEDYCNGCPELYKKVDLVLAIKVGGEVELHVFDMHEHTESKPLSRPKTVKDCLFENSCEN